MGVADGDNTEHNVHISVLGNDQTLDIYMCTDLACEHFCTKTNKRYHCPLCNNKPQKPGRMRRHFEKMHSGKQIVRHGGEKLIYVLWGILSWYFNLFTDRKLKLAKLKIKIS